MPDSQFVFQAFSWHAEDANDAFVVYAFGRKDTGESVALRISGYQPTFHLGVDERFGNEHMYSQMIDLVNDRLWKHKGHLVPAPTVVRGKSLWGFSQTLQPFFTLSFRSLAAYKNAKWLFQCVHEDQMTVPGAREVYRAYVSFLDEREDDNARSYSARRELRKEFTGMHAAKTGLHQSTIEWVIDVGSAGAPYAFATVRLFSVLDPQLAFFHHNDLNSAGWISVHGGLDVDEMQKLTVCDVEMRVDQRDIRKHQREDVCGQIRQMSFDLETYSADNSFSKAENAPDCIFQIGATCKTYAGGEMRRYLFHLCTPPEMLKNRPGKTGECGPIEGVEVTNCTSEAELLVAFRNFFVEQDPDLVYGYNSDGFDWGYLMERAQRIAEPDARDAFCRMSKLKNFPCEIKAETFVSAGRGESEFKRVYMPGRIPVDMMGWLKITVAPSKYDTWGLGVVAQTEIGETKLDMPYAVLNAAFATGDQETLTDGGAYCVQDCVLPQKIADKMDTVTSLFEMANISITPIMYLLTKGQMSKVISLICHMCLTLNYFVPVMPAREQDQSFEGATVVEPTRGMHTDPVLTLDFLSLYPTIFMAMQICYASLVRDRQLVGELARLAGDDNDSVVHGGVRYVIVRWTEDVHVHYDKDGAQRHFRTVDVAKRATGAALDEIKDVTKVRRPHWRVERVEQVHAFAQDCKPVLPTFLKRILAQRSAVKKMMAAIETSDAPEDKMRYRVLNSRQLALKVTANSVYGFPGAFVLNEVALSASVTAVGRMLNKQTCDFCTDILPSICRTTRWTLEDCSTYLDTKSRVVIDSALVDNETPAGWSKMYPSAVLDELWARDPFAISIVGGDTDSVFVKLVNATVAQAISIGRKAADLLTARFGRPPICMEYEKVHAPFLVHKKKNYAGLKYTINDRQYEFSSTGLPLAKRTSSKFLKRAYEDVMLAVFAHRKDDAGKVVKVDTHDPNGDALKKLAMHVRLLQNGQVPFEDLYLSKQIKTSYAGGKPCTKCAPDALPAPDCPVCSGRGNVVNLPHVSLADRMKRRDPGSEPGIGHRFAYVVIRDEYRDDTLSANTETPEYATQHDLPADRLYYLDNQLRIPLVALFESVDKGAEADRVFNDAEDAIRRSIVANRARLAGPAFSNQASCFKRDVPKHTANYTKSKRAMSAAAAVSGPSLTTFFARPGEASAATQRAPRPPVRKRRTSSPDTQPSIRKFFKAG